MNDKKEIEILVLDRFSFLQTEFGLNNPIMTRDTWNTTVSYLSNEIGIEIELDWRDLDVFILVTKLDKGKLPKGYYVSNGKVCRVHLEEVLQNSFNIAKNVIQEIIQPDKEKSNKSNQNKIVTKIERYHQLLHNNAKYICSADANLFKD